MPKYTKSSPIRLISSIRKSVTPASASVLKQPQCTSIPLKTAWDKMIIKKMSKPIVMLVAPSKNTPKIRKTPTINSSQGIMRAARFSVQTKLSVI